MLSQEMEAYPGGTFHICVGCTHWKTLYPPITDKFGFCSVFKRITHKEEECFKENNDNDKSRGFD
jgi:hypothetical protein